MRRGFTLIEIIVASVLFIGVGLLVVSMLLWGLDAYGQGNTQTQANNDCRTVLKALRDEIGHSALPPVPGSGPTATLGSSVIIPNPYQPTTALNAANTGDFTVNDPRSGVLPGSVASVDVIAFIEPQLVANSDGSNGIGGFNPNSLTDGTGNSAFNLVVYFVGNTASANAGASPTPAPTLIQHEVALDANKDLQFQFLQTGKVSAPELVGGTSAPAGNTLFRLVTPLTNGTALQNLTANLNLQATSLNNGTSTQGANPLEGNQGWQLTTLATIIGTPPANTTITPVVTLGDNDALSFVVSHAPNFDPSGSGRIPVEDPFETSFDRRNFQVDVLIARRFDTHVGTQRFLQVHQKDSVSIRSFN